MLGLCRVLAAHANTKDSGALESRHQRIVEAPEWRIGGLAVRSSPPLPPCPSRRHTPPATAPSDQPQGALAPAETRALIEAMRETARATREQVDYSRVVPDILTQILTKLDKIEDKLDKVENAIKAQGKRR